MIPTRIVPSVTPCDLSPRQVEHRFFRLITEGAEFEIAGSARGNPDALFDRKLKPKSRIRIFDVSIYLTNVRQMPELRFYVAYVVMSAGDRQVIYPRIFYKDLSLVWRSASHFTYLGDDIWVGKGDVRFDEEDGHETVESIEATTDLPLEIQSALESLLPEKSKRAAGGSGILELVLKQSPEDRVEPYRDFVEPRQKAQSNPRNLINGNQPVATFKKPGEPESLWIRKGFEPDFSDGVIERRTSRSTLYGGKLNRFRVLSVNKKIQYYFIAGTKHVWIIPPQATTTGLSSYGVRTIDVVADDDLFIPGYEYHHYEETANGTELYSQIPEGFAGEACPYDDAKADASPWLNRIPLIREFKRKVLRGKADLRVVILPESSSQ
ncbi:MAG: hypothetical protein AAF456_06485 [Planctomycetota bacterium]